MTAPVNHSGRGMCWDSWKTNEIHGVWPGNHRWQASRYALAAGRGRCSFSGQAYSLTPLRDTVDGNAHSDVLSIQASYEVHRRGSGWQAAGSCVWQGLSALGEECLGGSPWYGELLQKASSGGMPCVWGGGGGWCQAREMVQLKEVWKMVP